MQQRLKTTTITVLIVAGLFILLNMTGLLTPLRSGLDRFFNPIGRLFYATGQKVSRSWHLLGSINGLNKRNENLEKEVIDLKKQLADLREVKKENDILHSQLGFNQQQKNQLTPAKIVSAEADNLRRFLTIDQGTSTGVTKGMAVISSGALVGVIDEASSLSAKIQLISDLDFKITALGQEKRASGVVKGQLGQGLTMEKIAQSDTINPNETVITAGSGLVPKGIMIGTIDTIEKSDNAIFQTATLRPSVNVTKLELVFIITAQKP